MTTIVAWWTGADRSAEYHECIFQPAQHHDQVCVCSCGAVKSLDKHPCPNEECQEGGVLVDSMTLYGIPGGEDWAACETCGGKAFVHG
jgi:hypothetical protein